MVIQVLVGDISRITSPQQIQELYSYLGKTLYGFCNGYFGRNSYGNKLIEGIGSQWVVVKENNWYGETCEYFSLAAFDSTQEMLMQNILTELFEKSAFLLF